VIGEAAQQVFRHPANFFADEKPKRARRFSASIHARKGKRPGGDSGPFR